MELHKNGVGRRAAAEGATMTEPDQRLAAALTVLLSLLLLDAAVETFLSGSPVRWWVAGVVTAYAGVAAWLWRRHGPLWRRFGWLRLAAVSFLVLLGVIALSAWLPGGLIDGLRIFGQPTAVVLGVLTGVAVAMAGVTLARLECLPLWSRCAIGALTIYAAAAFIAGIAGGTPYPHLVHGDSLWRRLPWWLQGGFLGAALIVPAAFLVQGFRLIRAAGPEPRSSGQLHQAIALGITAAVATSVFVSQASTAAGPRTATALPASAGDIIVDARDAGGSTGDFDDEGRNLLYPEVKALVDQVGPDPGALLRFVSTAIEYEAYDGALRGSRGTLLAGAGNALDQSLLMRDLIALARPGTPVRFAFRNLTPDEARLLVTRVSRKSDGSGVPAARADTARASDAVLATLSPERRAVIGRLAEHWHGLAREVSEQAAMLEALLRPHGVELPASASVRNDPGEIARSHVWLQYFQDGSWIDLDPTLHHAVPGATRGRAERVRPMLEASRFHRLSIEVHVEARRSGRVSTRPVLETSWRTADLVGSTIAIGFAEPMGLEHLAANDETRERTIRYTPLLLVDDEHRLGESIVLPALPPARGTGEILGDRIAGFLRPGSAPDETAPTIDGSAIVGVWLRLSVTESNGRRIVAERPILDRIGFAARRSGRAGTVPLGAITAAEGHYLPFAGIWTLAVWVGERRVPSPLLEAAVPADEPPSALQIVDGLATLNRAYFALRSALFRSAADVNVRADRANVSAVSWTADAARPGAGRLTMDSIDPRLELDPAPAGSLSRGILWGTSNLAAERLVLESLDALPGASADGATASVRRDVPTLFDRARQAQLPILVLRPGNRAESVAASPDARARLEARLDEGFTVVVPARPVDIGELAFLGWWLVDPISGFAVDETADGGHQVEMSATTSTQSRGQTAAAKQGFLTRFARGVRCLGVASKIMLGASDLYIGIQGGDPGAIKSGMESVFDGLGGMNPQCAEGTSGFPAPPVAGGSRPPPLPSPLPRLKP